MYSIRSLSVKNVRVGSSECCGKTSDKIVVVSELCWGDGMLRRSGRHPKLVAGIYGAEELQVPSWNAKYWKRPSRRG